jgi:PAS domain S-box-containing protein
MKRDTHPRVMVVDDDPAICRLLGKLLTDNGFETVPVCDGQLALEEFARQLPDVLLLDLQLPGLDGLAVLAGVQGISPQTPVIIISGTTRIDQTIEALRLGAWDYITKPVKTLSVVLHAVEVCIERSTLMHRQAAALQELEDRMDVLRMERQQVEEQLSRERELRRSLEAQTTLLQSILSKTREMDRAVPYQVDAAGNLVYVGEGVARYGYSPSSLLGRPALELVHPEDRDLAAHRLNERRTGDRGTRRLGVRLLPGPRDKAGKTSTTHAVLLWSQGLYAGETPASETYAGAVGTLVDAEMLATGD